MSSYEINSKPPDISDLATLLSRAFSYRANMKYVKSLIYDPGNFFSCAYQSGDLVGFVSAESVTRSKVLRLSLSKLDQKYIGRGDLTAHVTNLSCASFLRRNGVAKALLADIARKAHNRGYKFAVGHYKEGPALLAAKRSFPQFTELPQKQFEGDTTYVTIIADLESFDKRNNDGTDNR